MFVPITHAHTKFFILVIWKVQGKQIIELEKERERERKRERENYVSIFNCRIKFFIFLHFVGWGGGTINDEKHF